ncbi:Galactosyl transferase [Micractinium conductrix]|uniref:Galactosyl transferase n=1 Tax=Micractinium conductrix TaxID=554055 RepID=A0A2P6V2M1_9CHLO|nr:Galactosyl transferase [Micractinium conductrix]|eukprot:PSC68339.1 Galactosyl transferase [Micractinium conductrix]
MNTREPRDGSSTAVAWGRQSSRKLGRNLVLALSFCAILMVRWTRRGQEAVSAGRSPAPADVCILHTSNYELGDNDLADSSMYAWGQYAERHGYRYIRMLVQPTAPPKAPKGMVRCSIIWRKVEAVARLLPQCPLLLLLDLDVVMVNASMPLDVLLQRWGFGERNLVLQPEDPGFPRDWVEWPDGSRHISGNTGLLLFRRHPRTAEIVEQWGACPREVPGCREVLRGFPCEQGVWNRFVRPTLRPGELVLAPCDEANGYPGARIDHLQQDANCTGRFIRHYWYYKERAQDEFEGQLTDGARGLVLKRLKSSGGLQRLDAPE